MVESAERSNSRGDHQSPLPPDPMTEPCRDFFLGYGEVMSLIGFFAALATDADEVRRIAHEALFPEDARQFPEADQSALTHMHGQRQIILQMLLTRVADAFLHYVSSLLALLFRSRPETLKTGQQVSFEFVLGFRTMDELVAALAEKRVTDLAYQNMRKLARDLSDRPGLDLFSGADDLNRAARIVAMRNLIVHNRAMIDHTFLEQVPGFVGHAGERLDLSTDVFDDVDFLAESVVTLDQRATAKFNLPTPARRTEVAFHDPSSA